MDSDDAMLKKFQKELNAGSISLVLLATLGRAGEPMYGYRIAKQLEAAADGAPLMKQGTLYPVLRALEAGGLLHSEVEPSVSGPPRRYYRITERGRETLELWVAAWRRTRDFVDKILADEEPEERWKPSAEHDTGEHDNG